MPLDNYTKDCFKRIVRDMGTIVSRIDRLISVADRPREEDREAKHPQGAPTQEEYAAIGKILFSSHVNPSVETNNETKKHWYETFDGWKQKIEFVALFFAMGYAWITYCQWRDSAKNFRIDERALIKAGASTTPVHPDPNQYLTIEVAVINIGKNPARKVHVLSKIVKLDSDSEVNLQDLSAPYTNTKYGILYPNTPTAFRTNWTDMKHALPFSNRHERLVHRENLFCCLWQDRL